MVRKIPIPVDCVASCVELCADSIRDKGLSLRLLGATETFVHAEDVYKLEGAGDNLHAIPEQDGVDEWITGDEMSNLYTNVFVRKRGPTRHIYNAIKVLADICPLCNQRLVSTLDHHLPKSRHPALAITPINLVPSCKDCNLDTRARRPKTASEQTIHPYFDDVDSAIWLVAAVIHSVPPAVVFSAHPPLAWPTSKRDKVIAHFRTFGLATLYSVHAGAELRNVYQDIRSSAGGLSALEIEAHLRQLSVNRRTTFRNSWQAAMYEALASSSWFCNSGYLGIA